MNILKEKKIIPVVKEYENLLLELREQEKIEQKKKKIKYVEKNIIKKKGSKVEYYNIPCSFDIETTNFTYNDDKLALMYCWMLNINGITFFGRTWNDFIDITDKLSKDLELSENKRLVIYIHNLSFEFQFIKRLFNWIDVFSLDTRKPIRAICSEGFEFRCSYLLSGYSLKKLAEESNTVKKLTGDLDYNLIRHSNTELTEKELGYCENDVVIVTEYIRKRIEIDGDITKIPMTKTGYVRNYCRERCIKDNTEYRNIISKLKLTSEEYKLLKQAYQGGFTHANSYHSRKTNYDVSSYDFTSSYPTVMIAEKFPMSKGIQITSIDSTREFNYYLDNYCCLIKLRIENISEKYLFEHIISISKCYDVEGDIIEDNGRLVSCNGSITLTITDIDYKLYEKFYQWDNIEIIDFWIYEKNYLPTDFVKAILQLYKNKTELKDIPEHIIEYTISKAMLNACYGMTVTDICRDIIEYIDEWRETPVDIEEAILEYNKSKGRFLYYPWGIWITAYARRNLFSAIEEFKQDYIYSDTDSIKVFNIDKHKEYIDNYNNNIIKKLEKAMIYHNLSKDLIKPVNKRGEEKPLGIWDFEGTYQKFKTLGAKRYMTLKDDVLSITVSGLNKEVTIPYLLDKVNQQYDKIVKGDNTIYKITGDDKTDDVFNLFDVALYVPPEYTGKLIHEYIDKDIDGFITDYKNDTIQFHHTNSVYLGDCDYNLKLSQKYIDWLLEVQEDVR